MYGEVRAKDVPHDAEVGLDALDGEAMHSEVLRQQRLTTTLHNKLNHKRETNN